MKEVLRFDNVSMHYHTRQGETAAVENLDFSVSEGEFAAIIGPSGCGKTTLLSLAAGLLKPSGGQVKNQGISFGYMLQKDELFPWRTIEKNIFLPLEIQKTDTPEHRARALALAEKYGLKDFLKNYPSQLSGGMRQRAALIRTLAVDPQVLLLDEPFSALDYQTRLSVCDDVYRIIRSERKTAVLITHDISEAISVADKIIVLSRRPARVTAVHMLDFPENEPLKRRENKEFSTWFELLWRELNK
ncbi:MAG TPA: ABC transporter ATP-binding protein [Candidatus Scatosoma pullistercoris]|uniref:ABC transporter ATP-binding protein n=1 Tax=Candidatus Scatosoma pullistercoris TaxID=2840934 RepID=A0A9D1MGD1_9FIRM|nr:ABC transporter ATP-binding protein [Candidatus Scatosoma pullistercoris]